MTDSPHVLKARLTWVKLYQETGNASLVCRRCRLTQDVSVSASADRWRLRCSAAANH